MTKKTLQKVDEFLNENPHWPYPESLAMHRSTLEAIREKAIKRATSTGLGKIFQRIAQWIVE